MDFLEGFLIGPVWSDTEYETRRHIGFLWMIGWVFVAVFAFVLFFPDNSPFFLKMPMIVSIVLFIVLVLASPFICRPYYRLNIFLKIPILIALALKYFIGMIVLLQICQAFISIDKTALPMILLNYVNDSVSNATGYFASLGKGTDILVGILAGGIWVVITFGLALLVMTVIPALYMFALKLIQRGADQLAKTIIFNKSENSES